MKATAEILSRAKDAMNCNNYYDNTNLLLLLVLEVLLDIREAVDRLPADG